MSFGALTLYFTDAYYVINALFNGFGMAKHHGC